MLPRLPTETWTIKVNLNCDEVLETEDQWSKDEGEIRADVYTDTMFSLKNFITITTAFNITTTVNIKCICQMAELRFFKYD